MSGPNVGEKAPEFTLPDQDFNKVSLGELMRKGKPVILVFFPAAFSPVCTTELCTFRDKMAMLGSSGATVVGISTDSPWCLSEFRKKNGLNFPLLSDYNKEVIKLYNVYHDEIKGLKTISKRAVFIVSSDGTIVYKWVSDNPLIEPDYDEVIRKAAEVSKA